ncbi:MAG: zinc ABC transporter substrate-binding protein [Thermosphaera sp.]
MRALMIALIIIGLTGLTPTHADENGLKIVSTFTSLVPDITLLTCPGDVVRGLIPNNVDPHDYALTPNDITSLKNADVIISTAHTQAELSIKELVNSGEVSSILIELTQIEGIVILSNPNTGQPNYHGILYDPLNYIAFAYNLSKTFMNLNPSKKECYVEKYLALQDTLLKNVLMHRSKYYTTAVADTPLTQYAVEWMGIRVIKLLKVEHDLDVAPSDMMKIEELVKNREVGVVVLSTPSSRISSYLEEIALENGLPVLYVESPLTNNSFVSRYISLISQDVKPLDVNPRSEVENSNPLANTLYTLAGISTGAILGFLMGLLIKRRSR